MANPNYQIHEPWMASMERSHKIRVPSPIIVHQSSNPDPLDLEITFQSRQVQTASGVDVATMTEWDSLLRNSPGTHKLEVRDQLNRVRANANANGFSTTHPSESATSGPD